MKAKRRKPISAIGPTDSQSSRDEYQIETIPGLAEKTQRAMKVRQLEAIAKQGLIGTQEIASLKHYRHHADIADCSLVRDSLSCHMPRKGGGNNPGIEVTHAKMIAEKIEADTGALCPLLRDVVVNDKSLSQFTMDRFGSREKRSKIGAVTICRIAPRQKHFEAVKMEFVALARAVHASVMRSA